MRSSRPSRRTWSQQACPLRPAARHQEARRRVYGVGAPSRASTLINYVGLDDGVMDYVIEIKGSYKIGKYIPGTMIPVVDESCLRGPTRICPAAFLAHRGRADSKP